ncbi:MAG: GNAT family N-acetyltransferase [Caulobacteraceae bacterium]|nr:GNAT family N-acetyltransferase [Caulobacteraceae bacterium]
MALLDWIAPEVGLRVEGQGVILRAPRPGDYGEWSDLRRRSKGFLQPWEPTWPADDLSRSAYRRRLMAYQRDMDLGAGYSFVVIRKHDRVLAGGITLSNIRRGVAQMGTVGYWIGEPYARQGHTLSAVRALTGFAFERLGLHRLEAACLPENEASRTLLLKAGFQPEGRAAAYLKINGDWRDHLLFGLVAGASLRGSLNV